MEMQTSEICRLYRGARDRKEQVRILAQLNACKIRDILTVLRDNGEAVPEYGQLPKTPKKGQQEKNKPELKPFADRLRFLVESDTRKKGEIAAAVGINNGALSSYINARYLPTPDKIERFAVVLNTTPEYLFGERWDEYKKMDKRRSRWFPIDENEK